MSNHYHILVETVDGHLSRGMRQLNGLYTQRFNRCYGLVGHLFQGRYKAILVQKDAYLLELSRYVVLNPVRAGMVEQPEEWSWSSYRSTVGLVAAPDWLDTDWLLSRYGRQRGAAIVAYQQFVMQGRGVRSPLDCVRHQLVLGDDAFVERFRSNLNNNDELGEFSRAHKRVLALSLDEYRQRFQTRDEAMTAAYLSGAYRMAEIASFFGVHYMTVSRAVHKLEKSMRAR